MKNALRGNALTFQKIFLIYLQLILLDVMKTFTLTGEFGLMNILEKICEWAFKKKEKEGYTKISLANKIPNMGKKFIY